MNNFVSIDEIARIRFGLYTPPETGGSIPYLQVRQFSDEGWQIAQPDEYISLDSKAETHLLQDGEVLFVGKGNRLFSWCYREGTGPAVASSVFFVLTLDQERIFPEFLAAVLNAPQSKAVFQQLGGGTNIFSIRKSELGAFRIPVLPMEQQKMIAALFKLHQQEIALNQQMITQKKNLYTAIISKLIK